jgi:F-box protein 11
MTKKAAAEVSGAPSAQPNAAITGEASEQVTDSPTTKTEVPTRFVDALHRGDFPTISEAIANVEPGTRIVVRPGLYREALVIDKPLEIVGDGEPGEIVIQAAGTNVIRFQATMGRLVNLTLRQLAGGEWYCVDLAQGRLELEDCDISSQSLACVAIHDGADPRLRRNRIHDSNSVGVLVYENAQGTLEDNDIFDNAQSDVEIKSGGNPTLRRNRIHDSKPHGGIFVHEGGQGTFEDNDIFGSGSAGIEIKTTANPRLRHNRIHDGKLGGVYVHDGGKGLFEDNDIFSNGQSGVISRSGGNPVVRKNRINKNGNYGVRVDESGGGTFENNDLTDNAKGPWLIAKDSETNVTRANNKE